ncbi:hypothetical protein HF1_03640 [Mycoplasma haemofelis str. Langford 1]|uniref:Uncharacterized protein n=1 Tax=Mycoplasma haemofelis (strain Langford 1) TaxID=941640 RepID=E8ZGV1_MYCHL|nr:hypothetical protein [Mycoplasma haemofelis]CBY92372.1 hypothetical protein HF1_03640 [Mycoplasma haemofelis str. Langford 1]
MSKLTFGLAGAGGVAGTGAFVAYQSGLLSPKPLTVKEALSKDGYQVVEEDEKFKEFFKEFKSSQDFLKELDNHKKEGDDLSKDEEGNKGKEALKSLCSTYFNSTDKLDNAIKWCVLRIQDKKLTTGSWINIATDDSDKSDWITAFEKSKESMIKSGVKEITADIQKEQGFSHVKKWCSDNKKLPINNNNARILENAISWCSKA